MELASFWELIHVSLLYLKRFVTWYTISFVDWTVSPTDDLPFPKCYGVLVVSSGTQIIMMAVFVSECFLDFMRLYSNRQPDNRFHIELDGIHRIISIHRLFHSPVAQSVRVAHDLITLC